MLKLKSHFQLGYHAHIAPLTSTRPLNSAGLCLCSVHNETTFANTIELNVTLGHAHFQGKLFVRPLGIPHTKLLTKLKYSFGAIDAQYWRDLDATTKQRSRSFILVPIDFFYTTSYRLSIVTFALGRTVSLQYFTLQTDDGDRRNTVPIVRPLVRSDKNISVYFFKPVLWQALMMLTVAYQCGVRYIAMMAVHLFWNVLILFLSTRTVKHRILSYNIRQSSVIHVGLNRRRQMFQFWQAS